MARGPLSRPSVTAQRGYAVALLTLLALAIHGYHPYSEDGGLYLAGLRRMLNPSLYPHWTQFATANLRLSLFAPLVVGAARATHLPLEWTVLLLHVLSIAATLAAAGMLAVRLTRSPAGQLGAVALFSCALATPVAGTSLLLMDPYLTARSFSTPLTLAALAWALDLSGSAWRRLRGAAPAVAVALAAAAALHPLMGGYGLLAAAEVACAGSLHARVRRLGPWFLGAMSLAIAAVVYQSAPPEPRGYLPIALSRYYWFPLRWQAYEQLGLVAPLLLLWLLSRGRPLSARSPTQTLAHAAIALGVTASLVAILFCRADLPTHLVARLQPLRSFQIVYALLALILGTALGDTLLRTRPWRGATALVALAAGMLAVERTTYSASAHFEWPASSAASLLADTSTANPWEAAFAWASTNTPVDALFALDAHYITLPGEDAQCFRAIAGRSALPDYSKDGGEASIHPELTAGWLVGQRAQTDLETVGDTTRLARLQPLGVTWIVLRTGSRTAFPCPYVNEQVKICRLP